MCIRARIDGVLYELGRVAMSYYPGIASRIKVLCNLDLTKKHKVQEGQITLEHEGRTVNLRVEVVATVRDEMIVIRIHEKRTIVMELSDLGFNEEAYSKYQKMLERRSGLVLVCGPTGCGKTTTLYSTLANLNKRGDLNVMTIEDPVEFKLDGVNQMRTDDSRGFTFSVGLKTILRLSPDVILVGEIRDAETAKIAVESGLTGQLVLSTIHAEDSVGALFRLLDLGIEPYLLNSALRGIVAQRLVRRNCSVCLTPYEPSQEEVDLFTGVLGRPLQGQLMKSSGCPQCRGTGYLGRLGIYEVLYLDTEIRDMLRQKINEAKLRDLLNKSTFSTLIRDGLEKCEHGIVNIDEVMRNGVRIG